MRILGWESSPGLLIWMSLLPAISFFLVLIDDICWGGGKRFIKVNIFLDVCKNPKIYIILSQNYHCFVNKKIYDFGFRFLTPNFCHWLSKRSLYMTRHAQFCLVLSRLVNFKGFPKCLDKPFHRVYLLLVHFVQSKINQQYTYRKNEASKIVSN